MRYVPVVVNPRTGRSREVSYWTDYDRACSRARESAAELGWVPAVARDTLHDRPHGRTMPSEVEYLPAFTYLEECDAK